MDHHIAPDVRTPFASTATVVDVPPPMPEHWRQASMAQRNLRELGMPRVNTLFVGADDRTWHLLASALHLVEPVSSWHPGTPMDLPETGAVPTLVIREVGRMSGAEQVRLLDWLDRAVGRTQVVSTSSVPLLPLVEDGRFINTLYYRLNTVCVDLNGPVLSV